MTIVPTGDLSIAKEALRQALADCPTWQSLCEARSAAEAVLRIYLQGLPAPADLNAGYTFEEWQGFHPFALISVESFAYDRDSSPGQTPRISGTLILNVERGIELEQIRDLEPSDEANVEWANIIGALCGELSTRNGGHNDGGTAFLAFDDIRQQGDTYADTRQESEIIGVFQGVTLALEFGRGH